MSEDFSSALVQIGEGSTFTEQLCRMILGTKIFADLSWGQAELLAAYMKAYSAPDGTTIFREGQPGNYMCLLISGKVDVIKTDLERHDKKVYTVPAGRILGEMAIIDGQCRSASCITRDSAELAILTRDNFHRLVQQEPALGAEILLKIARLLSERLRRTSGILVDYLDE
jgi:CRP-like cAMP-binding protein